MLDLQSIDRCGLALKVEYDGSAKPFLGACQAGHIELRVDDAPANLCLGAQSFDAHHFEGRAKPDGDLLADGCARITG